MLEESKEPVTEAVTAGTEPDREGKREDRLSVIEWRTKG